MRLNLNATKLFVALVMVFIEFNYKIQIIIFSICFFDQREPSIFTRINQTNNELVELEGYEGMILQTLMRKINFTIELIDCNLTWGRKDQHGIWNGIVGSVYQGVNLHFILKSR